MRLLYMDSGIICYEKFVMLGLAVKVDLQVIFVDETEG